MSTRCALRFVRAALPLAVGALGGCGDDTSAPATTTATAVRPDAVHFDGAPWTQPIRDAAVDPQSAAILQRVDERGGFGGSGFTIDFSLHLLAADSSTPRLDFTPTEDFFTPDCDQAPFPVPTGGALEGEADYACTQDGDCHLLVADASNRHLYEMWRADLTNGFRGGCAVQWDYGRPYPPEGRGAQCTSADAAGYPIAPLMFGPDEVAEGQISHAIRFVLPNDRIDATAYVAPATHGAGSGPEGLALYGSRWRLRPDFPVEDLPSEGARVVARALQAYGMMLADGGTITLTAQSDRFTASSWDGLLGPHDLRELSPQDFEILELSDRIPITNDCVR